MAEFSDDAYSWDWTERPVIMMDAMVQSLYDNDISKDTKQAIAMLLESMQPSVEQMEALKKQYEDLGMEIPKSIQETLANADLLGAMTAYDKLWGTGGDVESVWKVAQGYIANHATWGLSKIPPSACPPIPAAAPVDFAAFAAAVAMFIAAAAALKARVSFA